MWPLTGSLHAALPDLQVVSSSLINFIMLGVVFARFSAPFKRASTVCMGPALHLAGVTEQSVEAVCLTSVFGAGVSAIPI